MILLPVKPQYAYAIHEGRKTVEFRKFKFKRQNDKYCLLYVSTPIRKIIGFFEFEAVVGSPSKIWKDHSTYGCISKADYKKYYRGATFAVALKINKYHPFHESLNPKDFFGDFLIPQSFRYLIPKEMKKLSKIFDQVLEVKNNDTCIEDIAYEFFQTDLNFA